MNDIIHFSIIKIIIELYSLIYQGKADIFNVLSYFAILFIYFFFFLIGNFNRGYFIEKLERMD